MQKAKTHLPPFISSLPLEEIDGVRFTRREIEIISCILSGRAQKTIASFLLIAPRTVETHTRNIMLKLECNSRESIINFIEKAGKSSLLRNYYQALIIRADFEKRLKALSILIKGRISFCRLVYAQEQENNFPLIHKMEEHLRLAGFITKLDSREKLEPTIDLMFDRSSGERDYVIYIASKELIEEFCKEKKTIKNSKLLKQDKQASAVFAYLSLEEEDPPDIFKNVNDISYVSFHLSQSYYLSFFKLLKKIWSDPYLDKITAEFKQKYDSVYDDFDKTPFLIKSNVNEVSPKERFFSKKLSVLVKHKRQYPLLANLLTIVASLLTIIVLSYGSFMFKGRQGNNVKHNYDMQKNQQEKAKAIRSDLIVPTETSLLNRPEIMTQIEDKLSGQKGIQTLALVGMGGGGKTILARQYAHQQKINVIWEINAEAHESLNGSFENLAYALSKTEEDEKILRNLEGVKNPTEREEKIIHFVKERLKLRSNWFLIYDNMEKFIHIQKYFPHDENTWGQGKIIITTRDSNVQNNKRINHVIQIGELYPKEKLNLFIKIMSEGKPQSFTPAQKEKAKKFLEEIPPFPLDVSIAAYYLKATDVPYEKYLKYLSEYNKEFSSIQENILKEAGDYTKTRYSIITLSLQYLINSNKDFEDLLLFMSLVASQNIPRDMFDKYKSDVVVDDFIRNLKKYSFVINQSSTFLPTTQVLSIHRSTQAITLAYLTKTLNLERNKKLIQSISNILENYVDIAVEKEDFSVIRRLVTHCKMFLSHQNLLTGQIRGSIGGALGSAYYYLGDYVKAKETLEESLIQLNKSDSKNHIRITHDLMHLGNVYRELGDYEKAKDLLEQSLIICKKHLPENYIGLARAFAYLGIVYKGLGNYEKAKDLLEQSLIVYKKYFPENHIEIVRTLIYLEYVYVHLGDYEKAKNLLEQSLIICKKHLPENHIKVAWILANLGDVYVHLGDYKKAKNLLEQSLIICKKHLPENHTKVAWALMNLGNVYVRLGDYNTARDLLERSLITYEENYGKDHTETAKALRNLGHFYLLEGHIDIAEDFLRKSLEVFQKNKHPDSYKSLEDLAEFYLKKSALLEKKGDLQQSQNLKKKAKGYLKQALEIIKTSFSSDSLHIVRIQSKFKNIN